MRTAPVAVSILANCGLIVVSFGLDDFPGLEHPRDAVDNNSIAEGVDPHTDAIMEDSPRSVVGTLMTNVGTAWSHMQLDESTTICSPGAFDVLEEIKMCLELSDAAYQSIVKLSKRPRIPNMMSDSSHDMFLPIYSTNRSAPDAYLWPLLGGSLVLAFKGTDTFEDVKYDMNAGFIETDKGAVHSGFYRKFKRVEKSMLMALELVSASRMNRVILTGHSLGGALVTIAACFIRQHFPSIGRIDIITFASPKVGDLRYAESVGNCVDSHVRLINQRDPVPKLPPDERYRHVHGRVIYLPEFASEQKKSRLSRMIRGHKLVTYGRRLAEYMKQYELQCTI
jgi:hypothetical protein